MAANPNNFYYPYFPPPSPPPPSAKPPSHSTPPPPPPPPTPAAKPPSHSTPPPPPTPAAKPPRHSTPPPPPPTAKPPSHSTPPPPYHPFSPPPPPHVRPPPPPHVRPPPPPHVRPPPPPHVRPPPPPLPPSPSPSPSPDHPTVIVIIIISFGSVFFCAFLAVALLCFIKRWKKKTVQETDIVHMDNHRQIKETIVEGPHGPEAKVLSVEDDVHVDEKKMKNETTYGRQGLHSKGKSSHEEAETEIINFDEQRKIKEDIVEGPHGTKAVVLTVEDDVHLDEVIRKNNERVGKGLHGKDDIEEVKEA